MQNQTNNLEIKNVRQFFKHQNNLKYRKASIRKAYDAKYKNEKVEDLYNKLSELPTNEICNIISEALNNNELELYYQPQVDSATNTIVGLEALIRWRQPKLGIIYPDKFIPIAEKTDAIIEIGKWTIKESCRQNKIWHEKGLYQGPVSVNLSAKHFTNIDFPNEIKEILNEIDYEPKYLEIEITENIEIKDFTQVSGVLEMIKKMGVSIAIDDFGTAYSSINYIKQLPLSKVKIDKSFVDGIGKSIKDESILKTVITLIGDLGLTSVAEGISTQKQVTFLANAGCNIIQGYFYFKPMSAKITEKVFINVYQYKKNNVVSARETNNKSINIVQYLDNFNIRPGLNGFHYLVSIIQLALDRRSGTIKLNVIYDELADVYGVKGGSIERTIRYCIQPLGLSNKRFIAKALYDLSS